MKISRLGFNSYCVLGATFLLAWILIGCQKNGGISQSLVLQSPETDRVIGEDNYSFTVLAQTVLREKILRGEVSPVGRANRVLRALTSRHVDDPSLSSHVLDRENSLVVGFPLKFIREPQVFGAVVTAVSDRESENLGRLKLADLPPIHVSGDIVNAGNGNSLLVLRGCPTNCTPGSMTLPIIGFPVVGTEGEERVLLDLAAVGDTLNLLRMRDPEGKQTKLKTKSSRTVAVDYSDSTLLFDVEVRMIPLGANPELTTPETVFSVRWYLKLASSTFHSNFVSRQATQGVGFFMTRRNITPLVTRLPVPEDTNKTIHFYLKNVPQEHHSAFKEAFEAWNEQFKVVVGRELLSHEFLKEGDPRVLSLVTGDPRYHVVEWDLINNAPYGGMGPSIANQMTGEIMAANVLIQGPRIIQRYKKWFEVGTVANDLQDAGRAHEAKELLARMLRSFREEDSRLSRDRFTLESGKNLAFRISSQAEEMEDPLFQRDDFDLIPRGISYETYMHSYFRELLAHELGHNLGLRHNFMGNLGAGALGEVSHSVMEYLGRGYRHRSRIGVYDVMALRYGYTGVKPERTDLFCTDEDVASTTSLANNSAECSRDDATSDPFSYFEKRLTRSMDLLVARDLPTAPVWNVIDMERELSTAVMGLALYAATSDATASKWTHFFTGSPRPSSPREDIKGFVLSRLKRILCDDSLPAAVAMKSTEEARLATVKNIEEVRMVATVLTQPLQVFTAADLDCR